MPKYRNVSEGDNIIDSYDVIAQIAKLNDEVTALREEHFASYEVANTTPADKRTDDQHKIVKSYTDKVSYALDMLDGEDAYEELKKLTAVAEDGERFPDWKIGTELIRDDYFVSYAQNYAEDVGAIDGSERWPACHIDWEAAAQSLRSDYASVVYGNTTYWIRA